MILTGQEIGRMRALDSLVIEPFDPKELNPNSYNYRLGHRLGVPTVGSDGELRFEHVDIPPQGYTMRPGLMYLGHTLETLGSATYAMSLIGRSSLGRLGLFLQVSANLGHTGSCHKWTLELVAVKPFVLHAGMRVGQISFWHNAGEVDHYTGIYTDHDLPRESKLLGARSLVDG